jgi:hypothetical protein
MSDPFRMYEEARKHMYTAMEREADPPAARRGYEQAMDGFDEFLAAAAKNRGMYRELVGPARGHALPRRPLHLAFSPTPANPLSARPCACRSLRCSRSALCRGRGEQEKKALRMKGTCKQKLEDLGGASSAPPKEPPARPSNGVSSHRRGARDSADEDEDPRPPRHQPARAPSPRQPSPSQPSIRSASPMPQSGRAPSPAPQSGRAPSPAPGLGQRQPSPASNNRHATPTAAGGSSQQPASSQSKNRRRFAAESDSDSDSDKGRRERIRQSVARAMPPTKEASTPKPKAASVANTPTVPTTATRGSTASGKPTDKRRMRLDSDSDEDDHGAPTRITSRITSMQKAKPQHQTPKQPVVQVEEVPRTGPKPSTPAAKPRQSRAPDQGGHPINLSTPSDASSKQPPLSASSKGISEAPRTAPKPSAPAAKPRASDQGGPAIPSKPPFAQPVTDSRQPNAVSKGTVLRVRHGARDGSAHGSIAAAVEAAESGSIIEVEQGEYVEQLLLSKPITLKGLGDGVVLRSFGGKTLVACSAEQVHVVGMKMVQTGGDGSKRGRSSARCVEVFSGQLLLERCSLQSEVGSGLIVADSGSATVQECTLRSCGKCGLLVFDGGHLSCNDRYHAIAHTKVN